MTKITPEQIFGITPEAIEQYRQQVPEKELKQLLRVVLDWLQCQPHLPHESGKLFERRIMHMLRCNKLSAETTKQKLDSYYTVRSLFPEFLSNRNPLHPRMKQNFDNITLVPNPVLTENMERIVYLKLHSDDPKFIDLPSLFKQLSLYLELRYTYDVCTKEIYIIQTTNFTTDVLLGFTPLAIKKFYKILEKAYSDRFVHIHIHGVEPDHFFINLIRSILKKSASQKIVLHKDHRTITEYLPKELLPVDYDGTLPPLSEMQAQWRQFCEEHNDWFVEQERLSSNEKKRPANTKSYTDELSGLQGSFKKLDLD